MDLSVTTFYKFVSLTEEQLVTVSAELQALADASAIRGLVIVAPEGVNGTVCGPLSSIQSLQDLLPKIFRTTSFSFKDSLVSRYVFKDFRVKLREEVVSSAMGIPLSDETQINHLSPAEWERALAEENVVLIDTRNSYEYAVGHFDNALELKLQHFSDFPGRLAEMALPKEKKILMYCTGGIRCEKAIHEAQALGYQEVFQLEGGILNYLKEFPRASFSGECFVFDERVAVDQDLQPSLRYAFCPHCGNAADGLLNCRECGCETKVCESCQMLSENHTCSHNCAYHYKRKHSPALPSATDQMDLLTGASGKTR